ncbi:MAG: HD domain-containing protein [Paludisphaera borealis]|uniref:phosphonate degradation HD-domain oxygenase n=1 Tax=Paludisphaera borealis TaxID=1387353 RepID=UPI002845695E|nr:phosphonate degradation HD-domain oxygenase [Paludisphaera borealis]MDR3621397.1 HD domain-containing protein [Paludisphaera borealis]
MASDSARVIGEIRRVFAERGDSAYGGEAVSQQEHALQAAHLARIAGADAGLTVAALLHDVGHLLHDLPDDAPDDGVDDRHERLAASWLARWFGAEVVEPVRLHVEAKRYLCAVDPSYERRLSEPSRLSLKLQGGPMTEAEVEAFQSSPHHAAALALRGWDDEAKDPHAVVEGLDAYIPLIEEANRSSCGDLRGER